MSASRSAPACTHGSVKPLSVRRCTHTSQVHSVAELRRTWQGKRQHAYTIPLIPLSAEEKGYRDITRLTSFSGKYQRTAYQGAFTGCIQTIYFVCTVKTGSIRMTSETGLTKAVHL